MGSMSEEAAVEVGHIEKAPAACGFRVFIWRNSPPMRS
jgi:hypothetical protein